MATILVPERATQTYRRLLKYALPYWRRFVIAVLAMVVFASMDASLAHVMGVLVDKNIDLNTSEQLIYVPLIFIGLFFIRGVSAYISSYFMAWIGRIAVYKLRQEMFAHLVFLPARFYDKFNTGQLIARFTFNTEQVSYAVTNAITILIRAGFSVIFLLSYLAYLNLKLTLIFIVVSPLVAVILVRFNGRFRRVSRNIQNSMGDVTQVIRETVNGQQVIKTFSGETHEQQKFDVIDQANRKQNIKLTASAAGSGAFIQLLAAVVVAAIIYLLLLARPSPGAFVAYVFAMLLLMPPIKHLTTVNASLQKGLAAAAGIFEFLDHPREKDTGTQSKTRVAGRVEFREVCFSYEPDPSVEPVLRGVSFTVAAGQTIALVGRSGSGKTTLMKLLPRFYELEQGVITLDDLDIRKYRLGSLRSQIAIVSQNVVLFNDTLANNIAYGSLSGFDRGKIEEAATAAHAMEFIRELPLGLDTFVGDKGIQLSGGQQQRIAIARALLKDAPILILDEATSALDSDSEQQVQRGLERLKQNRTTFVIAHRLSTVENADCIVVLERGKIVEQGTHEQLRRAGGEYARFHDTQMRKD